MAFRSSTTAIINTFLALVIISIALTLVLYSDSTLNVVQRIPFPHLSHSDTPSHPDPPPVPPIPENRPDHPIDHLISAADRQLQAIYSKETHNLHDAAKAYRERRGRQPPPGFDKWYEFAHNHSTLIVEEFWDQVYHDLNPFWGVPAKQTREQAFDFLHRVVVRNKTVTFRTDGVERPWMLLWSDLVRSVAPWLPDMDLPINVMDESRLMVPWDEINGYMRKEKELRRVVPEEQLKDTFHGLAYMDETPPPSFHPEFVGEGPLWRMAALGCSPDTPARSTVAETDFSTPPPLTRTYPEGSFQGYVSNFTLAKSPCDNPDLQGLHGSFVEPVSLSTSQKFFPLFGGSKLPMNNEILLPAAMYWTDDPFYSGGKEHGTAWSKKKNGLIWRGAASGGRNRKVNWTRFQRHRFIAMVNGTSVEAAEIDPANASPNFVLPDPEYYSLSTRSGASAAPGGLGKWIKSWSNAVMVHLLCFPQPEDAPHRKNCPYTDPYFSVEPGIPMREQYDYKYLPDIDGNSFSGRYRGFLGSTSMPIKATIYQEWHDSRLVPWKHFVPMDNTFIDIYGIMEYFIGNTETGVASHDDVGEEIAMDGKAWTEKVLRREDMQVYVFRLLLEYARICDDDREVLGWREGAGHVAV